MSDTEASKAHLSLSETAANFLNTFSLPLSYLCFWVRGVDVERGVLTCPRPPIKQVTVEGEF